MAVCHYRFSPIKEVRFKQFYFLHDGVVLAFCGGSSARLVGDYLIMKAKIGHLQNSWSNAV